MNGKRNAVLGAIALGFLALTGLFAGKILGRSPAPPPPIPLVDPKFVDPAPSRVSIADTLRKGGDISDYDCYVCHERNKPIKLNIDAEGNVVVPTEHKDIVMGHGTHKRNNNCFNCHDENNLELLQTRDGRQLKLTASDLSALCGSCHGPTYRDWEAGVHGRTSGYWDRKPGDATRYTRLGCPSCHNPHSPKFQGREPAPGPHRLHEGRSEKSEVRGPAESSGATSELTPAIRISHFTLRTLVSESATLCQS